MAHTAHLPHVTDCFAPEPRAVSLSERKMAQAVFVFVVAAGLALAHIHLQFAIRDLRAQHRKVQEQHQALVQQQSRVQHDIEAECDSARLRAYGRDMEMVEPDVHARQTAAVPESLTRKYLGQPDPSPVIAQLPEVQKDLTMKEIMFKLADVNKAFAGQLER